MIPSLAFFSLCLVHAFAIEAPGASGKQHPIVKDAEPAVVKSFLNKQRVSANSTANSTFRLAEGPKCKCQISNPAWKKTMRNSPKCIFVDLGAANGNTFEDFKNNRYGDVKNCAYGTGDYEAFLVEANPRFEAPLKAIEKSNAKVHAFASTAAYMCEATTSFYLDTVNKDQNYWGSSLSTNHQDTKKSGLQKVTVPTANLMKILYENTIPGDYVIVKMDIEGAEWDILPCLANAPIAHNIDRLYLEQHPADWAATGPGKSESVIPDAKAKLTSKGVDIPQYFSQTF
jgi:FkbM family methyltransferase